MRAVVVVVGSGSVVGELVASVGGLVASVGGLVVVVGRIKRRVGGEDTGAVEVEVGPTVVEVSSKGAPTLGDVVVDEAGAAVAS